MPVTDADLEKQRERNEKLREQIAEAAATRADRESEVAREVEMAQLKAEEARLSAELENQKSAAKATSIKAGAAGLLGTVSDQEAEAATQTKAAKAAGKE